MTVVQRRVVLCLSLLSLAVGIAWQFSEPGFEPWLFVICGLIGLFSQWWPTRSKNYASKRLTGTVTFDYSNNNGRYIIGHEELLFETAWSKASDISIHIYNDPPSIDSIAIAPRMANIKGLKSVSGLDFSSRSRTPQVGDVVVLKNKYGKYAALKISDIKDNTRSDSVDELTFSYVINPDGGDDFR